MRVLGQSTNAVLKVVTLLLPLEVVGQTCKAQCGFQVVAGDRIDWKAKTFSTTITAATVIQVVNTDEDTTRYSTVYNKIPAGYTIPTNTNAQGTQTVQVQYHRSGELLTTELAFPTQFNWFPEFYTWSGTLGTTDAGGQSICSTADKAKVEIDYWSQDTSFTTPTHSYGPDPGGLLFTTYGHAFNMIPLLKSASPSEAALQSCSSSIIAPANAELTARFITATSTSYESGTTSKSGQDSDTASYSDDNSSQDNTSSQTTNSNNHDNTSSPVTIIPTGQKSHVASQTPVTVTMTSTSMSTYVTDSPSGPVTLTKSVDVVNVVVSSPSSSPEGTTYKPSMQGSGAGPTRLSFLVLLHMTGLATLALQSLL